MQLKEISYFVLAFPGNHCLFKISLANAFTVSISIGLRMICPGSVDVLCSIFVEICCVDN